MSVSSMNKLTQKDFDTLPIFLSEQADSEIEINDNDVEGVIYIAIGSEDNWLGFNFKADITKSHTAGELWKDNYGTHTIDTPTVEISNVTNITVSCNDSNVGDIDYTSRIDDINKLISDFVYDVELTAPPKHNAYNTYLI